MVTLHLYVEGGGNEGKRRGLKPECRRGFREFLLKADFDGRMPRIVACGSRGEAFDSFTTACSQGIAAALLVDSEGVVTKAPVDHLKDRDKWDISNDVDHGCIHLMVQCMENWLLADKEALAAYFGHGFRANALPANPRVEKNT